MEILSVEDEHKQFVSCHLLLLILLCFDLYLDFIVDFGEINEIFLKILHLISELSCCNNILLDFGCFSIHFFF